MYIFRLRFQQKTKYKLNLLDTTGLVIRKKGCILTMTVKIYICNILNYIAKHSRFCYCLFTYSSGAGSHSSTDKTLGVIGMDFTIQYFYYIVTEQASQCQTYT